MVDPLSGAAVAKALSAAGGEGAKETGRLLGRVLGPSADEIGEALRRYTAFRVGNVARIAEKAESKGAGRGEREVPPRVAHRLLEEGSYCDDELMVEYLSGVLAASSTPGGRDDRAVVWSDMVTGLSSLQVRAHFLLYREWAVRLHGRSDLNLGMEAPRAQCEIHVELVEFLNALVAGHNVDPIAAVNHAIVVLAPGPGENHARWRRTVRMGAG